MRFGLTENRLLPTWFVFASKVMLNEPGRFVSVLPLPIMNHHDPARPLVLSYWPYMGRRLSPAGVTICQYISVMCPASGAQSQSASIWIVETQSPEAPMWPMTAHGSVVPAYVVESIQKPVWLPAGRPSRVRVNTGLNALAAWVSETGT